MDLQLESVSCPAFGVGWRLTAWVSTIYNVLFNFMKDSLDLGQTLVIVCPEGFFLAGATMPRIEPDGEAGGGYNTSCCQLCMTKYCNI